MWSVTKIINLLASKLSKTRKKLYFPWHFIVMPFDIDSFSSDSNVWINVSSYVVPCICGLIVVSFRLHDRKITRHYEVYCLICYLYNHLVHVWYFENLNDIILLFWGRITIQSIVIRRILKLSKKIIWLKIHKLTNKHNSYQWMEWFNTEEVIAGLLMFYCRIIMS